MLVCIPLDTSEERHACRKRRPNFDMCSIFAATYKLKMGIHVENDGPILHAHDLPRQAPLILMCAPQVLTRRKRRLDSMCSISRTEGVSRVLSSTRRTAAADAHMQSWMAVMLDQKRPKTAVRFDVHISSETKTRAVTCFYARKRWSILACACFSRGKSH